MTAQELLKAKKTDQTITGPFGPGKVNGIGATHTYIYYPGTNRVIEAPNNEIRSQP